LAVDRGILGDKVVRIFALELPFMFRHPISMA